ncbi:MAG: HD domain-containing protein [Desulfonauticus sp.]|nr:HD domain-containing protein [Desulfonauticus sp.]
MYTLRAFPLNPNWPIPDQRECLTLWRKYQMPKNIQEHSWLVGNIARQIFSLAKDKISLPIALGYAAGLLHDLGKNYTIKNGGAHSQIGASLVLSHFFNPALGQAILHHVHWPGPLAVPEFFLPLTIIYSDKRAKHNQLVSLQERFDDLLIRYGTTEAKTKLIQKSYQQALDIERLLSQFLGVDLRAYSFSCRRMV